jgi:hypothetical protein
MKISQTEIQAASRFLQNADEYTVRLALHAAYSIRRIRKTAKRERQRKALVDNDEIGEFKPCVVQYEEARITEIVLEDCFTVWVPHEGLELGYNNEGNLIAVKVYGLVAQRKEKDKHVVESVQRRADMSGPELKLAIEKAMHVAFSTPPPFLDSSTGLADPALSATSKAPEWDGTFKAGEYQMRNGEKAIIDHIDGIHLCGKLSPDGLDCCFKWELSSGENNRVYAFDLIRPWPKGEQ